MRKVLATASWLAVAALLLAVLLLPGQAHAWGYYGHPWHHGWEGHWHQWGWRPGWHGWAGHPPFWVPGHWAGPYWVRGHWA